MSTLENILGKGNSTDVQGTVTPATPTGNQAPAAPQPPTPEETSRVLQTETPQATDIERTPIEQQQPKRMSYEDMFKQLNPYQPPTQEELEKERKKQKREQIFAAIGDGISALSNLYFTTQYAPNMYTGTNTASQRTKERWDKLAADRNANMKAYIDGLMKARQADDAYNDNEREWERQLGLDKIKQERDKAADARAEAEEERKKELHPFAKRKAEGDAQRAEAQAKYAEEYEKSKIGRNKAAAGASNAAAGASRARARYYDRGGSGGSKSKDMQEAYDYWMSLTDEQKNQYRNWNKRVKKYNPVYNRDTKKKEQIPVYMDDDDDFIQMVWKQRQGYLNSHGNFNKDDYRRGRSKGKSNDAPPLK